MSGVSTATIIAGATLAATAAGTIYTMTQSRGGGGGGQVTTPPIAEAPTPPKLEDPSVAAAALAQQSAAANARGRASTILTSGMGDQSAVTTNKKQLLGA